VRTLLSLPLICLIGMSDASVWADPPKGSAAAVDTDRDGLSDFEEVHKYRTNPAKADTDGDGVLDGDWNERREHTYSIRCLISHMPPAQAVSDGWQDAREVHREKEAVEIEIVAYPLATPHIEREADGVRSKVGEELARYIRPNLTNDFDDEMCKELLAALDKGGIHVEGLGDRELVKRVAGWAMDRVDAGRTGFNICYVTAREGRLVIEEGLESYARAARSDPNRSLREQLDIEVRGASMFRRARCGACTSTAVYLQTILRALGVPTRTTIAMPPIDSSDESQLKLLREGLRPSALRDQILEGASPRGGWVEHTINVVWVGGRWMRLNYDKLGQPVVDPRYLGLMLRFLDYDDRATAGTARTWGRWWALGLRSARYPGSNPYRLLSLSDRMGKHATAKLQPSGRATHKKLTVVGARWSAHGTEKSEWLELDCREWFQDQGGDQYKRFTESADRVFFLRARGRPDVEVFCGVGSFTSTDRHGVAVFVPRSAFNKIEPGTPYRLVPRNRSDHFEWAVSPDVTVTRD
jgi:hypothetical protein